MFPSMLDKHEKKTLLVCSVHLGFDVLEFIVDSY